jgi:hypothetical protein
VYTFPYSFNAKLETCANKSISSSFLVMFPKFRDLNYFLLLYVNMYSNSFPKSFPISLKYFFFYFIYFSFNLYFLSLSHFISIFFLSPSTETLSLSLPHPLDLPVCLTSLSHCAEWQRSSNIWQRSSYGGACLLPA